MDFNSTGLQSILNESIQHKSVKLIMTVNKAEELINMISSTFGPDPYKKIIVDSYQGLIITSDTSKILSSIKLVHPIQFLLRDILTKMSKYGDGNTFLVLLLGKILNRCKELLGQGMPSYTIVDSLKEIKSTIFNELDKIKREEKVDFTNKEKLKKILDPILKDENLVSLLSEAVIRSKFTNPDDIRIQKVQTGSIEDSFVINGMFIENSVETTMDSASGKSVIYNTSLDIERSETKGTLLFEKADDMLNFSKDEDKSIEALVNSISENTNIVFFNGNVNERFVEFFNTKNVMVVRVISKFDLRRLMRMSESKILQNIRKPLAEDTGSLDSIETVYQGGRSFLQIEKNNSNIVSIVLKDSLISNLNETELLLEKGIKTLDNLATSDFFFVQGGGDLEKHLSNILEIASEKIKSSKRLVFSEITKALREFENITPKNKDLHDIFLTKKSAYESAFDIACEVLMIEDYLVGRNEGPVQQ